MNDQMEIRLIVEEQLSTGMGAPAARPGTAAAQAKGATTPEGFREKVARERERIRRRREDERHERSGVGKHASDRSVAETIVGGVESRTAAFFSRQSGSIGSAFGKATDIATTAGKFLGASKESLAGISNIGAAGKIIAGGANFIEQFGPALVAGLTTILANKLGLNHLPGAPGDKLSDMISGAISEAFNAVSSAASSGADTLNLERAKVRIGGATSIEQATNTYKMFYEVNRQQGELRDRFARDINKDLGNQIAKLMLGN